MSCAVGANLAAIRPGSVSAETVGWRRSRCSARILPRNPKHTVRGCAPVTKDSWRSAATTTLNCCGGRAKQGLQVAGEHVPKPLAKRLASVGIDASVWADLVWNWQKYFGQTACVGRPESMKADAESLGKQYHRGQLMAQACFK